MSIDPVTFARSLIDIDSTTGREADVAKAVAGFLQQLGYQVAEQPVSDGRFNV
jgi:hypothetical protein